MGQAIAMLVHAARLDTQLYLGVMIMKKFIQRSLNVEDFKGPRRVFASLDQSILHEQFSIDDVRLDSEAKYADIPGVTMVFDLAGSSASIRQNGPKDFVDRYAKLFDHLTTTLYQHDGIIEKFPGDGISAHFLKKAGESTLKNARNRAVKATISIREYMKKEQLGSSFRICLWSGEDSV